MPGDDDGLVISVVLTNDRLDFSGLDHEPRNVDGGVVQVPKEREEAILLEKTDS